MKESAGNQKISNNRMGLLVIVVITCVILLYFRIQSRGLEQMIADNKVQLEQIEQEIKEETDRTDEIEQLKAHMKTDEFAEEIARDRLGLVKDNEIVFYEKK